MDKYEQRIPIGIRCLFNGLHLLSGLLMNFEL